MYQSINFLHVFVQSQREQQIPPNTMRQELPSEDKPGPDLDLAQPMLINLLCAWYWGGGQVALDQWTSLAAYSTEAVG